MTLTRATWLNFIGLLAICTALLFALTDQIVYGDMPCPLCIMQRAGLIAAGTGLALNLGIDIRPSHYGVMILGAVISGCMAIRQILLHIVSGTGSYGHSFVGLHFYTWVFIISGLIITGGAIMLMFDSQFKERRTSKKKAGLTLIPIVLLLLIALVNAVSTVLECGAGLCPDNPTGYLLLP